MPAALFSFDGTVFHELTANAGDYFKKKYIGRGASCADYDNDGDWDLVVDHQNDQPALLKNESPGNHYLKFRLIGTTSNRTGYGTQITLKAGDREVYQELVAGTSYVSSNEPALIFGLGDYQGPCNVQVRWPNGKTESFDVARTDQCLTLIER